MELYTCDNCQETYEYGLPICPGCLNDSFDVEELSDCCGAEINDFGLCRDCKEPCK